MGSGKLPTPLTVGSSRVRVLPHRSFKKEFGSRAAIQTPEIGLPTRFEVTRLWVVVDDPPPGFVTKPIPLSQPAHARPRVDDLVRVLLDNVAAEAREAFLASPEGQAWQVRAVHRKRAMD